MNHTIFHWGLLFWIGLRLCAGSSTPPNIVYILADDLGIGDLSCYGQTAFSTPHMDKMAAEGMRFTQHYAGAPICAPSRASLMTGMHLGHADIRSNRNDGNKPPYRGNHPLPADRMTIARALQQAGYETAFIGKWGLGGPRSSGAPWKQGFDHSYGFLDQMDAHFYYPPYLWNGEKIEPIPENADDKRSVYVHDLFTQQALTFLKQERDRPFFLYLAYTIPHAELLVPEEDLAPFRGKFKEVPYPFQPRRSHYAGQPEPLAAYAGMITRLDRDVGRILDLLRQNGLAENTLVIFSSDNGSAKEGGADPAHFNSSGGLRGFKRSVAEGGIRVPMIAWQPGTVPADTETGHVSAFWDVAPTLAEAAGVEWTGAKDGISFLPTLHGEPLKQTDHAYLFWGYGSMRAVRMGDWKGIYFHRKGRIELYNLIEDPAETTDLSSKRPDLVRIMERVMSEADVPHSDWKIARPVFEARLENRLRKPPTAETP